MNKSIFQTTIQNISEALRGNDIGGVLRYVSFPYTLIENDFTLVFHTHEQVTKFYAKIYDVVGDVEFYRVKDPSMSPIGNSLFACTYSVAIAYTNGFKADAAKRLIVLREGGDGYKATASVCFIDNALTQVSEMRPDVFEELKNWQK